MSVYDLEKISSPQDGKCWLTMKNGKGESKKTLITEAQAAVIKPGKIEIEWVKDGEHYLAKTVRMAGERVPTANAPTVFSKPATDSKLITCAAVIAKEIVSEHGKTEKGLNVSQFVELWVAAFQPILTELQNSAK